MRTKTFRHINGDLWRSCSNGSVLLCLLLLCEIHGGDVCLAPATSSCLKDLSIFVPQIALRRVREGGRWGERQNDREGQREEE